MSAGIVACAADLSGLAIDNTEFASIGLTSEWIERRSGISSRHWWPDDAELHVLAGKVCRVLRSTLTDPGRSALIVVSTSSTQQVPTLAALVAAEADMPHSTLTFDMNSACSGFVSAITTAAALVDSGQVESCIVCTVEAMSRLTNRTDRKTAFLFGDGAAAVRIEALDTFSPVISRTGTDGSFADLMRDRGVGIELNGIEVFDHAVTRMTTLAQEAAQDDPPPTVIVPHQANGRILTAVERAAGVDVPFVDRITTIGNTSSASIPLALHMAVSDGEVPPQGRLTAISYGAGETWGSVSISYDVGALEPAVGGHGGVEKRGS